MKDVFEIAVGFIGGSVVTFMYAQRVIAKAKAAAKNAAESVAQKL